MKLHRNASQAQSPYLTSFAWATTPARPHAAPAPARRIRDRFGLSAAAAAITAELAGFTMGGDR